MKKVLFAALAGLCVITSIMATPAEKGKSRAVLQIKQSLTDTVPPKDTTKKVDILSDYSQVSLTDTVPPKDTTKKVDILYNYNQVSVTDTVPPKDTTKKVNVLYIQ